MLNQHFHMGLETATTSSFESNRSNTFDMLTLYNLFNELTSLSRIQLGSQTCLSFSTLESIFYLPQWKGKSALAHNDFSITNSQDLTCHIASVPKQGDQQKGSALALTKN